MSEMVRVKLANSHIRGFMHKEEAEKLQDEGCIEIVEIDEEVLKERILQMSKDIPKEASE